MVKMNHRVGWIMRKASVFAYLLVLVLLYWAHNDELSCTDTSQALTVDSEYPRCGCVSDTVLPPSVISSADGLINDNNINYRQFWLKKRSHLIENERSRKVLFFAYMRGGSTIGGEVFNQNDDALMWYEPGDAFFMAYYGIPEENLPQHDLYHRNRTRRSLSEDEQRSQTDFYENELTCRYQQLPAEAMGHHFLLESSFFRDYTKCLTPHIGKGGDLTECVRYIAPICGNTVETSTAEKCHIMVKLTRELFGEDSTASERIQEAFRRRDQLILQPLLQLFQSRLRNKMTASRRWFDPRLYNKLSWFIYHRLCLESVHKNNARCIGDLVKRCESSDLRVLEVNRMLMEDTEPLVRRNPDIYVFYYVRDPRAIAVSRCNTEHMVIDITDIDPLKEAHYICHKMATDLSQFRVLQASYPGVYNLVKYEDLVLDPEGTAARIYNTIGRPAPDRWRTFAKRAMQMHFSATRGINRSNSPTDVLNAWRIQLSRDVLDKMNLYCEPVLKALNYYI